MTVELVRTTTADGHSLDGSLHHPAPDAAELAPSLRAIILIHGVGGNFYRGGLFDSLAEDLRAGGISVLRVNTRGHDLAYVSVCQGKAVRQGSAFERVADCRQDILAWIQFLVARGYDRLGLLGHSLGAIKVLYAAAHEALPCLSAVLAVSPPRLSYKTFRNSSRRNEFLTFLATAEQHLQEGQPDALFSTSFPVPLLISAASYVDKYGPGERYDLLRFVERIATPTFVSFGELELAPGNVAFCGLPEELISRQPLLSVVTVERADHFYTGAGQRLSAGITAWLRDNVPV